MAGTPTTWAGFPIPAEGDLPDVPVDARSLGQAVDNALKMLMTTGTGSSTAMPAIASTGGANLLSVGSQIASLVSTQSTQAGQISSLQTTVAPLANQPAGYNLALTGSQLTYHSLSPGGGTVSMQQLNIPSATFKRLLTVNTSATFGWVQSGVVNPITFATGITIGAFSYTPVQMLGYGPTQSFSFTFQCTLPAGAAGVAISQYMGAAPTAANDSFTTFLDPAPVINCTTIPWTGADLTLWY